MDWLCWGLGTVAFFMAEFLKLKGIDFDIF